MGKIVCGCGRVCTVDCFSNLFLIMFCALLMYHFFFVRMVVIQVMAFVLIIFKSNNFEVIYFLSI